MLFHNPFFIGFSLVGLLVITIASIVYYVDHRYLWDENDGIKKLLVDLPNEFSYKRTSWHWVKFFKKDLPKVTFAFSFNKGVRLNGTWGINETSFEEVNGSSFSVSFDDDTDVLAVIKAFQGIFNYLGSKGLDMTADERLQKEWDQFVKDVNSKVSNLHILKASLENGKKVS